MPRESLLRLTVDVKDGKVKLNHSDKRLFGRSAYLCKSNVCLKKLIKGNRLKNALEGRKKKNVDSNRSIKWPLESQLIKAMGDLCTDPEKTCQNTET